MRMGKDMTEEQSRILFETLKKGMNHDVKDEPGIRRFKNLITQAENKDKKHAENNSRD